MPRAPKTARRITAADVEQALDTVADIMSELGARAHLAVPVYKRLERELERLRDEEAVVAAALDRVRRSQDRTAGQPS